MRFIAIAVAILALPIQATCPIWSTPNKPSSTQSDTLFRLLQRASLCPQSVQELKKEMRTQGLNAKPAMVANRGRHNPAIGSFSFFESTGSDFYFGHFTGAVDGEVVLDQSPDKGKLLIEAIAWDNAKQLYNFYELIGTGNGGRWFYRGDSQDILLDNAERFGNRLRCSACHSSGGPIMKELAAPHNDWWMSKRPLPLAPNRPSPEVAEQLGFLIDASDFSLAVKEGIHRLEKSKSYQAARASLPMREQLRPLYCENEINIESDLVADEGESKNVIIPSAFFLNPLLGEVHITMSRQSYHDAIAARRLRFPETHRRDADHAWLTPVKGYSDLLAIETLIEKGVITREFAKNVLSVDKERPLFSKTRCAALEKIPLPPFLKRDKTEPFDPVDRLIEVREEVLRNVISQNPRGQILEPGFRVIFPTQ